MAARLAWSKALAAAHRLDFDGAIPHAHTAARSSRTFRDLAAHTEKLLLLRCMLTRSHSTLDFYFKLLAFLQALLVDLFLRK